MTWLIPSAIAIAAAASLVAIALHFIARSRPVAEIFPTARFIPQRAIHELNGWGDNLVHKHLLAVQRNGRIAVLYSSKDYSSEWNYHPESKRFLSVDNTRFAVNLVVYALTA